MRTFILTTLAVCGLVAPSANAEGLSGEYLEARNADVWTGPCFANGEMNIVGNRATMAWKINQGSYQGVSLKGLSVVAVVFADKTLGLFETPHTKTLFLVDDKGSTTQREALVALARELAGETIQNIVEVKAVPIDMITAFCDGKGCARLNAGHVQIRTRCLHGADSICGHEELFYPVLSSVDHHYAAYTVEHKFTGNQFGEKFEHGNSRSAVIGTFRREEPSTVAVR